MITLSRRLHKAPELVYRNPENCRQLDNELEEDFVVLEADTVG